MKNLLIAGAIAATVGLTVAGMQGHIFICFLWWALTNVILAAYASCCWQDERKEAMRRQKEEQLRTKNREDICKIQEQHVREQLLRDHDKIKL